jgi:acetate kinase
MAILAVNAGSSSLKFSLHEVHQAQASKPVLSGVAEGLEPGGSPACTWTVGRTKHSRALALSGGSEFSSALRHLGKLLNSPGLPKLEAVTHRVVHGGPNFQRAVRVTADVLADLRALIPLSPLHQPHNLAGIEAFAAQFPELPQVACFDTAWHATLPQTAYSFALPAALSAQGIRRYGFHGLSYQYIMSRLQQSSARAAGRVLMAHLGNGASLCAARDGKSCATTMGFTALDGLMMGTRCGAIDPGILLYLMSEGWSSQRLSDTLYLESGLLGVSGISADMRTLRADQSPAAQQAIEQFTYQLIREAGAMSACLGGLNVLSFSGGIGENDIALRQDVCEGLRHLGVVINDNLNQNVKGSEACAIHEAGSSVEVWVIPTDECIVTVEQAAALLHL